ncbi:MAG: hypothetical protein KAT71_07405, partial [Gammaproteobacteria bacterium]|nr:hypothetical protein [Gammaproteobacteria bacterium]
ALPPLGERRWNDIAALFSVRAWADFVLQKLTTLQLDPANDKLMLELKAINQIYDANIMQRLALSERAPFVRDFCTESQSTLDADQLRKLKFLLVLLSCEADGSDPTVLHFIHFLDALSKNNLSANQLYYQELSQKQQCYLRLDKFITELQAGAVATANTKLVVTVSKSLIKTIFWLPIDDGYKLLETLLIDINNLTAEFGPEELYLTLYAVLAAQPAPGSMQSLAMVTRDRLQVGFIDEQRGMLVNVLHEVFTASYPETIFARRVSYKDLLMAAVRLGKLTILAKLLGRLKKLEDGAQFIAQVTDELVTGLATAELGFLFEGFAVTTESIAEMVDPGFLQQLICLQAKAISQSLYISEVDDNSLECVETLVKSVPLMRTFLHDQLYNGVRTKRLATTAADALQTEKEACKKLRVFSILAATRAVTLAEVLPAARDAAFDVKFCNTVANFFKQLFVADHLVATSNATAIYQGLGLDETITMQELGEITNHEIFAFIGELVTELDLFGLEKIAELMGALTYLFLNRKIFHADKAAMQQGYLHLIQHLSEIAKTYSRLSGIDDGVRAQLLAKVTAAKHFCRRVFQSEYDLDPSALLPDFVAATAQYLREFPLWWSDLEADQIKRRSFKVKVVMCGELIQFFPEQTANLHHFLQDLDELKGLRDYKAVTEFNIKIAAGIKQLGVLGSDAEPLLQDALGDFMVRATRVENFIALARDIIVGANSDTSEPAVTLEKLVALYTKESKTALQKVVTPLHNMLWRFAKFTEQDITIENIVKLRQWYYKLDNMLDKLCFLPSAGKLSLITAAAQKLNGSMEKIDG